jgi:hypothetical protein
MNGDGRQKTELQLTGFHLTLLSQVQDEGGTSLGPIASSLAGSYVQNSRKRHQAVRGGLIALEQAGYIETVDINPRRWRITPEGRAAIS